MAELQILISAKNAAGSALNAVKADLDGISKSSAGVGESLKSVGQSMTSVGGTLTATVTLPLVGIGAAAMSASTDLNRMIGNIQSLGLSQGRVVELKSSVQELAITMGKSTSDMADGLYQVISTFGDSADAVTSLEIAAKAGAAGLATTTDAINLIASVTKGYGDTSIEAQKHVSDLAFQTVNLGQTTFPELAASMGKVTPIAAALGVTQEELFAQMATLTGVTGSTAEVTTQLRATYQAILKPTKDMSDAIQEVATKLDSQGQLVGGPLVDAWRDSKAEYQASKLKLVELQMQLDNTNTSTSEGAKRAKDLEAAIKDQDKATKDASASMIENAAALGPALVKSAGLNETLGLLAGTAEGNTNTLGKMFGSVESLNAVLALSGGQADSLSQKMSAMNDVSGATDAAFKAQTEGINATGFTMEQLRVKVEVLMEKLGDALAPSLAKVLDALTPLIDKVVQAVEWFANADASTQQWIIGIAAAAAAIGPLLIVLGAMISTIGTVIMIVSSVGSAIALLSNPIGWIVLAIGALSLAWATNFMGIRDGTAAAATWIGERFSEIVKSVGSVTKPISALWDWIVKLASGDLKLVAAAPEWISVLMLWTWPVFIFQPTWAKTLVEWAWPSFISQPSWARTLVEWAWPGFPSVPSWVSSLMNWSWPSFPSSPSWVSDLFGWSWPSFPSSPSWLSDLLNWRWPSLPSFLGGNAQGTTNFSGGMTWVGESGPELVALPASSRIYNNRESQRMTGSGGSDGGFSIVIQNAYMRSEQDITRLAYEIDDILKRRRR